MTPNEDTSPTADETIDVVEWDEVPTVEEPLPTMAELMASLGNKGTSGERPH